MLKSVFMVAVVAATTEESCGDRLNASQAQFPPAVGSKMLHEDARQVIWDLSIAAGERCAVHEHVYDYSFHVLEASTLAVYSGETAEHLFSFDTVVGETKAFERRGTLMYDRAGLLPPFDAVHGVANVGSATYREILVESGVQRPLKAPLILRTAETGVWRRRSRVC